MGKPNTTLGIEVGDTSLKLALFDHKQHKVLRLGVVEVSAHPLREVELLEKAILQWMDYVPDTDSLSVVLAVPTRISVVRRIELPRELKDVREYVEWEFANAINAPRGDYYMDFEVIKASGRHPALAIVGAMRKVWLDTVRKGFQRRNLVPSVVEVDAFSLLNLMEAGLQAQKTAIACIVKVDRTGVIVVWGQNGSLKAIRWVSVSLLSTMGRVDAFKGLAADLTDQLHKGFAQVGVEEAAGQIVHLCGDLSVEADFVDALRKSSPDFLYHLLDSFHRIQLDAEGASSNKAPLCAAAIGAALRFRGDRK